MPNHTPLRLESGFHGVTLHLAWRPGLSASKIRFFFSCLFFFIFTTSYFIRPLYRVSVFVLQGSFFPCFVGYCIYTSFRSVLCSIIFVPLPSFQMFPHLQTVGFARVRTTLYTWWSVCLVPRRRSLVELMGLIVCGSQGAVGLMQTRSPAALPNHHSSRSLFSRHRLLPNSSW